MNKRRDPLLGFMENITNHAVRALAVLMCFVVIWSVIDVARIFIMQLIAPPFLLIDINQFLDILGAFLAVLIAIEIFINITIYLKEEVIHVRIVIATALMAIARKVILFNFQETTHMHMFATAAVILALSIGYWLITSRSSEIER